MNARIQVGYGDSATFPPIARQRDPQIEDWTEQYEARIRGLCHHKAEIAMSDPAYAARLVDSAQILLHELRVKLHGESMTWERAVFEVLHMGSRRADPEAIRAACDALRAEVDAAIRRDAGVYGIAAQEVREEA